MTPRITDLAFDEENEAKIGWHGLTSEQLIDVVRSGGHLVVRNRKGRRASHLVLGWDRDGRCIAIPVEPTIDPRWWRPVTAWECKDAERTILQGRTR